MLPATTPTLSGGAPAGPAVQQVIILTGVGTSFWTVPANWTSGKNSIECIGGGGNGAISNTGYGGGGGGGGAYQKRTMSR